MMRIHQVRATIGKASSAKCIGNALMKRYSSSGSGVREMTVRDALNSVMEEEMRRDERVFLMGEEVGQYNGAYKVSRGLLDKFGPKRVIDTPITEMGFTGLSTGAAFAGLRPICEFMTFNFSMQAIDHIVNSAARTNYMSGGIQACPIVFRGPNGPASAVAAQHSQHFGPWYGAIPGLKVISPYSAEDARGMLRAAIRDPNPVVVLENELLYGKSFPISEEALSEDFVIPFGVAKIERPGKDITLVGESLAVTTALEAADILKEKHGVEAEVINLRSIRPIDVDTIVESVKKTNRVVTVEQAYSQHGLGSEIAAQLMESSAFDYLDAPVERVAMADVPMPYSTPIEAATVPNADVVVASAEKSLYLKK
ncbi:pyruvate dehydrogenase e1 component beta subunit Pdb1 [Schizosaccharomyces cryophilus OY26]|uniref:Pyruvate dehydrogenase E1 component subunit beta n=1 Tax=Schizosaccharomyces cryophilus (strain OY26 / ATCC MYA-4695 / CBS 11777 / NBRC 106824 / NRRL Y48691) TaxID=653667 RepID=S9W1R6_SCHCR|nr:pyruvate dehydrogenase e1 component beta subunit Pdb1 [Schizosaccharomyces cryophilus OY26]EPY53978.1 pyruvate dehydrogenase e1 component beta subunit Pdb1 [Schizosaccharomyces cryophilus OY26]